MYHFLYVNDFLYVTFETSATNKRLWYQVVQS